MDLTPFKKDIDELIAQFAEVLLLLNIDGFYLICNFFSLVLAVNVSEKFLVVNGGY